MKPFPHRKSTGPRGAAPNRAATAQARKQPPSFMAMNSPTANPSERTVSSAKAAIHFRRRSGSRETQSGDAGAGPVVRPLPRVCELVEKFGPLLPLVRGEVPVEFRARACPGSIALVPLLQLPKLPLIVGDVARAFQPAELAGIVKVRQVFGKPQPLPPLQPGSRQENAQRVQSHGDQGCGHAGKRQQLGGVLHLVQV